MRKTKRDIHKEIMYNKIMPTSYAKKNADEPSGTKSDVPTISFPEDADINDIIQSEIPAVSSIDSNMGEQEESAADIAEKIDTENENIVKILSEYNEYKEKKSALRKTKSEKALKQLSEDLAKNNEETNPEQSDESVLNEDISEKNDTDISEDIPENEDENTADTPVTDENSSISDDTDHLEYDILGALEGMYDDDDDNDIASLINYDESEYYEEPSEDNISKNTNEFNNDDESDDYNDIFCSDDSDADDDNNDTESSKNNTESDTYEEISESPEPANKSIRHENIFPKAVNLKELIINGNIDEILEKFNCCNCMSCKAEITAHALNRLSPEYIIVNNEEEMNIDITETDYSEITSALIHAIIAIRANPVHK